MKRRSRSLLRSFGTIPFELVHFAVAREHTLYPNAAVGSLGVVRRCKRAIGSCEGTGRASLFERGVEYFDVEQDRFGSRGSVGPHCERASERWNNDVAECLMRPGIVCDPCAEEIVVSPPLQAVLVEIKDLFRR